MIKLEWKNTKRDSTKIRVKKQGRFFEKVETSRKNAMTRAPVLVHFNKSLLVEVNSDASGYAFGVVVLQRDADGLERVVAYGAATLNTTKRSYSTTERECLAIVYTCEKYRYYLLGRPITVYSDCHSLCWLLSLQSRNSRLVQLALRLQEFQLLIVHKAGKMHADGDCLSRCPVPATSEQLRVMDARHTELCVCPEGPIIMIDVPRYQKEDAWTQSVIPEMDNVKSIKKVYFPESGLLYRWWKSYWETATLLA